MSTSARGEVLVGGDAVRRTPARRIDAGSACSRASTSARQPLRNSGSLVSASTCSPVSASSTRTSPSSGRSSSIGSTMRMATTSWRWASRVSGALPAGVADEVGDDEDQAAPAGGGRGQRAACAARSVVRARCRSRRPRPGQLVGEPQHVGAAGAGRDHPLAAACRTASRRPGCRRGRAAGPGVTASSVSTDVLAVPAGPNRIDADRSSTSHAVSSRSSVYWRTYGSSSRAVTFQSMCRTSSSGVYVAQVGEVDARRRGTRAVRALQPPVEAADDLPLQAPQQAVGRAGHQRSRPQRRRPGTGSAAITRRSTWSAVTSSDSASYDSTSRCRRTSRASSMTSCGSA